MKKLVLLLLCLTIGSVNAVNAASTVNSAGAAKKVCMPFFELINVHADYQYSTARLFKSYVDEQGKYELVIPNRTDTASQPPADVVRAEALQQGCPYYLIGDMNRISESVIVSVALYSTEDGGRLWGDKLKAANPNDLDPIFQKLARAIGTQSKAASDGDIYSVTTYEERNLRQMQVRNSFGLAVGGAFFTPGLLTGHPWNDPFLGGLGLVWSYDARTILFEVDAETYGFSQNSNLNMVSLSAFKPLAADRVTPFFGGGLGLGYARTEYKGEASDGTGLVAHAGAGVMMNRTSTVQLRFQARYIIGLYSMSEPRGGMPRALLARMELAFGR